MASTVLTAVFYVARPVSLIALVSVPQLWPGAYVLFKVSF